MAGAGIDPSAIEALIELGGYDPALGARPMRRTIGRLVESKLASTILAERVSDLIIVGLVEDAKGGEWLTRIARPLHRLVVPQRIASR